MLLYIKELPNLKEEKALELLKLVGLEDRQDHKPVGNVWRSKTKSRNTRALVNDPKILLG